MFSSKNRLPNQQLGGSTSTMRLTAKIVAGVTTVCLLGGVFYLWLVLFRPIPGVTRIISSNGTAQFGPPGADYGGYYRSAAFDVFCASHGDWIKCWVYSAHPERPFYSSSYAFTSRGRVYEIAGLENNGWLIVDEYHYSGSYRDFDYHRSTKPRPDYGS